MQDIDAIAQAHADRRFAGVAASRWRVCLGGWPCIVVPGENEGVAVGNYYAVCGITASAHLPAVELVEEYPPHEPEGEPEPVAGLKELSDGEPG